MRLSTFCGLHRDVRNRNYLLFFNMEISRNIHDLHLGLTPEVRVVTAESRLLPRSHGSYRGVTIVTAESRLLPRCHGCYRGVQLPRLHSCSYHRKPNVGKTALYVYYPRPEENFWRPGISEVARGFVCSYFTFDYLFKIKAKGEQFLAFDSGTYRRGSGERQFPEVVNWNIKS